MKIGSEREILPRIISHLNTCELPAHGSFVGGLEIGYPVRYRGTDSVRHIVPGETVAHDERNPHV